MIVSDNTHGIHENIVVSYGRCETGAWFLDVNPHGLPALEEDVSWWLVPGTYKDED